MVAGSDSSQERKGAFNADVEANQPHYLEAVAPNTQLHRGLKARQVSMIAIGGAIGTGLIIGTGTPLKTAGPAPLLIGYSLVGFLCYLVMAALGEMAAWLPLGSSFAGYADRFVDPALGFALGWNYWFKYIIVTPNNLVVSALVLQYWVTQDKVNPGAFVAVFMVAIIFINYFGIRFFGEFEFWLSSIKVIVLIGLILLSLILACGGGPDHDPKGFRYWKDPGAFHEYVLKGAAGRFLAVWSVMTTAVFAYLGTELVGVTVGECQNPRKVIPRAIRLTFYRILVFYVVLVFLLGMIVPWNSKELNAATGKKVSAAASPFVVAIQISGIKSLPAILNGAILVFTFSAANSDLYIASRTLYGLAVVGNAPKIFKWTDKRGVPVPALALSSCFCLLAFLCVTNSAYTVFGYFRDLVTIFGLLTWIAILITHIAFVDARRAQGVPNSELAFVAPLGKWGSFGALLFCILIAIFKGFPVFIHNKKTYGNFDYKTFITNYLGIPMFIIMAFGYKFLMKSHRVKPAHADLFGGKQAIDDEEAEFVARQMEKNKGHVEGPMEKIYNRSIGLIL